MAGIIKRAIAGQVPIFAKMAGNCVLIDARL
jgi:hypothetical protein